MRKKFLCLLLLSALCVPWMQAQTLFYEGFEGGSIPSGWTQSGSGTWTVATGVYSPVSSAYAGSKNAKISVSSYSNQTQLITPVIDLSGQTSVILTFAYANVPWDSDLDKIKVYYRSTSTDSWHEIDNITTSHTSWTVAEYTLIDGLTNTYQLCFEMNGAYGRGVGLDEVTIVPTPSCVSLKTLSTTTTRTSVTANWTLKGDTVAANCLGYEVKITATDDPEATAIQSAVISNPATTTYTFNHLDRETTYYVHVRSNCGNDDGYSAWVSASATTRGLSGCYDNIVANGTATNSYVPFEGYNYDGSFSKSQFIYSSDMMTALRGKALSKMVFFSSLSSKSFGGTIEVRIGVTTANDLSSGYEAEPSTVVYSGPLTVANNQWTIDFGANTFDYPAEGGNLLIQVKKVSSGTWGNCSFYGTDNNVSGISRYNDGSNTTFLPKAQFSYCETAEACPAITNLSADDIDVNSAVINWTASTADYFGSYDVLLSDSMVTDLASKTPQYTGITATSLSLTNLDEYADYYVYVRVNCNGYGKDEGAAWSEGIYFQTLSPCNVPTNLTIDVLGRTSAVCHWTTTQQPNNYSYILSDSVVADLEQVNPTAKGIYADSVLLTGLTPGTTYYFYLSNKCGKTLGQSPWISTSFIVPNACLDPDSVYAYDIQHYQITLNWVPNQYADTTDTYDVLIDTVQISDFASVTPTATGLTGTSYTFDTLFRNTIYYMYVRANCSTNWLETTAITDSLAPDCQEKQAGSGTGSTYDVGVKYYSKYGYGQTLINANELGDNREERMGTITSISFDVAQTSSYSANWKIYLGHTSESSLTSWVPYASLTEVATKTGTFTTGWNTIELTTPFEYNGLDNLVVAIANQTGNYSGGSSLKFRYEYKSSPYMSYIRGKDSDSSYGDPTNTTSGSTSAYKMNMKFTICNPADVCPVIDLVTIPAEKVLDDQAFITWTRGTGDFCSSYNIIVAPYQVTKPDSVFALKPAGVVIDSNLVDTFYLATGLQPETRYYVYVRANCKRNPYDDGSSNWKLVEPAFTTEKACVKPFAFQVTGATSTTMSLQWLNRKQKSNWELGINDSIVNVALSDDTCRYTVTNLTPNTEYTYTLRSICGVGDTSDVVTLPGGYYQRTLNNETNINVLAIPNLELIPNTIVQDTLNHTISATFRKGSDLTNVYFEYDRSDYVSKVISSSGNVQGNYGYINLTTPNTLTVVAEDTAIRQDWIINPSVEPCATPYNVAAANISRRTADLTWNIGDSVATSFDLVLSTTELEDPSTGTIQAITATNEDGACTFALTELSRNQTYYAYIRTNCDATFGQWRGTNFTTLAATGDLCPEVADLTVTNILSNAATITWTATGDYPGTSDIYVAIDDTTGLLHTTTGTSYTATGLIPYTDYNVYVRTHCNGEGQDDGVSPWVTTTFKTESECEYPRNVEATVTGKNSVHLSWTDAEGQTPTTAYEYAYSTEEAEPASGTTNTTGSADITGLAPNTNYYFYVRKVGAGVSSPWIKANEITTPAAMPAPIIEEVYDISFNAFRVRWTRDYANFANETQWQYACVASGESPSAWTTTTDTTALIYGLTESTIYDFHVRATNGSDNSATAIEEVTTTARPADCMTIGVGTSEDRGPIGAFYGYERNIYLFTPADGLTDGTIQTIAWNMTTVGKTVPAKIYLKNTTETDLSSVYTGSFNTAKTGATLVYDASFTSAAGWNTIDITDFDYTGGNLMVLVESNYGGSGSSSINAYYTQSGSANHVYARHDSSMDDDMSLNNNDYFYNYGLDNKRSNIQFCFEPATCPKPTHLVVDNITTTGARASWYPGNTEENWKYYVATEQMTDAELDLAAATTTTLLVNTLSGLSADMDYHFYVQANCSATESSKWAHIAFTTLPTCSAPINAMAESTADNEITFDAAAGTYGTVGSYDFRYWRVGTTDTITVADQTATYVATNVAGGDYDWQVRSNCGITDGMSRWTAGNRVRVCGAHALPYTQGFEDLPTTYSGPGMIEHICWNDLNATVDLSYTPYYHGYMYYYSEGNRSLLLKQGDVDTLYLILPSFGDAENLCVKFDAAVNNLSVTNRIKVGYMTDITDESTFVPVYTAKNNSNWTSNTAYIRNLPAGARLAFSYEDSNYGITQAYFDNVRVDTISNRSLATSVAPNANFGSVEVVCQASDTTTDGRFYDGATPILQAVATPGYSFTNWTNANTGDTISYEEELTILVEQDTALVANFVPNQYHVNVVISSEEGQEALGDVSGYGTYDCGASIAIEATNITPYYHVVWPDGSTDNPHQITVPAKDTTIVATFTGNLITGITTAPYNGKYDGAAHKITVNGTQANDELTYSLDSISWETSLNLIDVSAQKVFVKVVRSNYYDYVTSDSVIITKRAVTLTSASDEKSFNGEPLTNSNVTVSGDGFVLDESATYNVTGSQTTVGNCQNLFTYSLTNGAKADNYKVDTIYGTLTVTAAHLSGSRIEPISNQTYTGDSIIPDINVMYDVMTLVKDSDYTVAYTNNVNVGTATATAIGKGNFTGSTDITFTIEAADIATASIAAIPDTTYTGSELAPDLTITFNGMTLVKDQDYTVAYSDNLNVGTATATVTGVGNFTSTTTATFTIKAVDIASASIAAIPEATYTGSELAPDLTITFNGMTLVKDQDYTVAYSDNVNVGTATATVTGMGNFTSTTAATFTIKAADIASASIAAISDVTYTGSELAPDLTITFNGMTLVKDQDYTVAYADNLNVGTATATVTGMGNFTSTTAATFTIKAADIASASIAAISDVTYTGSELAPDLTVTFNGMTLVKDQDYTVAYADNVNVGTATATVTGMGNFTSTTAATFTIKAADIASASIAAISDVTFTGSELAPDLTITFNGMTLVKDQDYTVAYADNLNVGTATATVTGIGNYTGTQQKQFTILPAAITGITTAPYNGLYDGAAHNITVSGTQAGDEVTYSTDNATWVTSLDLIDATNQTVYVKVARTNYSDYVTSDLVVITKRSITLTSATDTKEFDGTPLTNNEITVTGDGFVSGEGATYNVTGSQTKVGLSANTFSYSLNSGTKDINYDIITVYGELTVTCTIEPLIVGMYDKWNIMLNVNAFTDTLEQYINGVVLQPENVKWYIANGVADEVDANTGAVVDDQVAQPATGFFHTEDKAMTGSYYCVVYVPEAQNIIGVSYFRSNVLWVESDAPARNDVLKYIQNGQLFIESDGVLYNAQGQILK